MNAYELESPERKLVMWYKCNEKKSQGLTKAQIARELGLDVKTVRKYLRMSYDEFKSSESYKRMYTKMLNADILAIDDIMLFPVKKEDSAAFFNLINTLHEKVSLIITTNKSPTEWAETLDDEVLASALLDRLLYKCEVIKLSGASYRMENRQTILKKEVKRGRPRKNPATV